MPNKKPNSEEDVFTIPNFPNYAVTKDGRVWSCKGKRFLKPILAKSGYCYQSFMKNRKCCRKSIHRLVLETFVGLCPKEKEACHNNGIRDDNRLENLRWDTRSENIIDAIKHGTHNCVLRMKLTEKDVINIVSLWNTKLFRQREIADMYKVGQDSISRIVNRKRWKYIWQK